MEYRREYKNNNYTYMLSLTYRAEYFRQRKQQQNEASFNKQSLTQIHKHAHSTEQVIRRENRKQIK